MQNKKNIQNIIILENIRSAYNVGNVIRTADALGRGVWLVGYTPSPDDTPKVKKTSLWAEDNVSIQRFDDIAQALQEAKKLSYHIIAAEITDDAVELSEFSQKYSEDNFAVIFGNEVEGVEDTTIKSVDHVVYIPMLGIKESLNIGQSTAILMWGLRK